MQYKFRYRGRKSGGFQEEEVLLPYRDVLDVDMSKLTIQSNYPLCGEYITIFAGLNGYN